MSHETPTPRETQSGVTSRGSSAVSADHHTSESSSTTATRGAPRHLHQMSLNSSSGTAQVSQSSASIIAQEVPSSIFYNYPSTNGSPAARWAHSACSIGSPSGTSGSLRGSMIVFGGIGHATYDDLWCLDTESMQWRGLSPRNAKSPKDRPDKTMAHAAAAIGCRMFVFGGQQGRKLTNKLFVLEIADSHCTWMRISNDSLPTARAGHAMVAVGGNKIFMFGGQGKKLTNDLHVLDPQSGLFKELKPRGLLPAPRRGMSLVPDNMGSLICFGGTNGTSIDNALSVYSLQRNEWTQPQAQGQPPSARTDHSAVLIAPEQMLVFGGCNAQGTFFNDAYVLDTKTFTWHRPKQLNSAPAPRYHHSCVHINGRSYLYGGINAKQSFDGVVVLDSNFAPDMSHIADHLSSLVMNSCNTESMSGLYPAEPSLASVSQSSVASDLMRVQLQDLLYKRNMEEMQLHASRRAEVMEGAMEGLRRDEAQARVLHGEASAEAAFAAGRARDAELKAARDAGALAALRSSHQEVLQQLAKRDAEAESARLQHQSLVKELGLVSSRYAHLQQQFASMCAKSQKPKCESFNRLSDGAVMRSSSTPFNAARGSFEDFAMQTSATLVLVSAESGCSDDPSDVLNSIGTRLGDVDTTTQRPTPATLSGNASNMLSVLADVEAQREGLQAKVNLLTEALEAARLEKQRLEDRLRPSALEGLPLQELLALELELESVQRATREAIMVRRIADAAAAAQAAVTEQAQCQSSSSCSICLERPRNLVFSCGHQCCEKCGVQLQLCHFCRLPITAKIKMFDA